MNYYLEELKAQYHYKMKHLNSIKYPLISAIELTNHCNSACIFCPHRLMTRKKEHMKFETFKKIIDEIKNYPQGLVWTHLFGEPLLHPQLIEFIKYAKNVGVRIGVSTNCMLLDKKMSKKLLDTNLDNIILCLDAYISSTYEKLRVGLDYFKVVKNIENFLKLKEDRKKPYVQLQFVENYLNKKEINEFKFYWKGTKGIDEIIILPSKDWAGQVDKKFDSIGFRKRNPCSIIWKYLAIHSDGNVTICCTDYDAKIKLGNVNNESLKDIWNGEKLKKLREMQLKGNYINGLCDICNEWRG